MTALVANKRQSTFPAILLLAFLIRLIGITSRPIWYDEAFAILFSAKGPAAMVYGTLAPTGTGAADIHPLGYYTSALAMDAGFRSIPDRGTVAVNFCGRGNCCNFVQAGI